MISPTTVMTSSRRDSEYLSDRSFDGLGVCPREINGIATIPVYTSSPSPSSSPSSSSGLSCIHHRVSKMDTLAGVAIKYGVEVSDIKRLNGLVSDLQMFAHKSLQIPLPGRHPPSPSIPSFPVENEGDSSSLQRPCNDVLDLIESFNLKSASEVSPAMSRLQGYYGLTPLKDGVEVRFCIDDEQFSEDSSTSDLCPSRHRKSKSLVNAFTLEDCEDDAIMDSVDSNGETDRSIRRRQKTEGNQFLHTPELLIKDDSNCSGFQGRTARSLAPRPRQGSKCDMDMGQAGAFTDSSNIVKNDCFSSVRKSSSTSCLQDSENNFSMWPAGKWILKPEVIAGFPAMGGKRNKAALD